MCPGLLDCSKLVINWKNSNDVTIFRHDVSSRFFDAVLFLLSSWVTGPSFMSISSLVLELGQFSFISDWPEMRKLKIPLSNKMLLNDWMLLHLSESPARVTVSSIISRSPISCLSLNSNYIVSSKSFAKDEMISTKNLSITDVTKNSVNSKPLNNSKSLLNDQKNLGSNLHKVRIENPSRIIFGQININSIRNKFDLPLNLRN